MLITNCNTTVTNNVYIYIQIYQAFIWTNGHKNVQLCILSKTNDLCVVVSLKAAIAIVELAYLETVHYSIFENTCYSTLVCYSAYVMTKARMLHT